MDTAFYISYFKKRFDKQDHENCRVYGIVADQKLKLNQYEIKQGRYLSLQEIEEKLKKEKFLPETGVLLPILRDFIRHRKWQQ